jgi:betaine-aldehyde dehydrogenase
MPELLLDPAEVLKGIPTGVYIDGRWRDTSGDMLVKYDPVTERELAQFADGDAADVDEAVAVARREFETGPWSRMRGTERGRILNRLADLIERDGERLASIQALENGSPLDLPLHFDVVHAATAFRYQAGWADKLTGTVVPDLDYAGHETHSYIVREPVGVVAAILPWNGPLGSVAMKLAPALAAGCTAVVKPAEQSLLSVLHFASLIEAAGVPAGVVNIVPGRGESAGEALIRHPGINKISFTGSVEVGRHIQRVAAEHFTRVTLELGGKAPTIIFADADLENAVRWAIAGVFANQGQVCAAGSRILVQRPVLERVTEALGQAARSVRLGDPRAAGVTMGPLITREQQERVLGYIRTGRDEGARLVAGGEDHPKRGYFVAPTIFADATNDMVIAREEIFGPVGIVIPFDDEDEGIAIANHTGYGLSAAVYTSDISRAHRLARAIRAGTVWVNGWGALDMRLPWGGVKDSGVGREGGLDGLLAYTEPKTVRILL